MWLILILGIEILLQWHHPTSNERFIVLVLKESGYRTQNECVL